MTKNTGWISLYRKFTEWEWYDCANVKGLFIHCLLKANRNTHLWRGVQIKEGQFVTSLERLSSELGMSVQQVRTALSKLKSTNEISVKSTNAYSMITVNNYAKYQGERSRTERSGQQAANTPTTTNNNDNKENKYKFFKRNEEWNSDEYYCN